MRTTPQSCPRLITTGTIAELLGVSVCRVTHVIRTREHIRPAALAGRVRLFLPEAIAQIRHELTAIDARSDRGGEIYAAED